MVAPGKELAKLAMILGISDCDELWPHCEQQGRTPDRYYSTDKQGRIWSLAKMTRDHVQLPSMRRLCLAHYVAQREGFYGPCKEERLETLSFRSL